MAHLSQPLDLATNVAKKMEQSQFSDSFTDCIMEALRADPKRDVTIIKVDLKLSTLKSIHAKTVWKVYKYLKSEKDKQVILNRLPAAGIMESVNKVRENTKCGLNLYWIDYWVDIFVLKKSTVVLQTKLLFCQKLIFFCFSLYKTYIPASDLC